MTDLLDRAVLTVRALPPETQDDIAKFLLPLAGEEQPAFPMTAEEEASFDQSLAQAERAEFAIEEWVRAIWAEH